MFINLVMYYCYFGSLGNDLVDEEVDIGGNEPPVSSYPAVEIERDGGLRSNRSNCKSGLLPLCHGILVLLPCKFVI